MAYVLKCASCLALIFIFVILSVTPGSVEGQLCERASQTWSGSCTNTGGCNDQCISWESARNGACHTRGGKKMCFCYFGSCNDPRLCEKASQTWSGSCGNTAGCDNQCKTWENALHGACHTRSGKKKCFCYFKNC